MKADLELDVKDVSISSSNYRDTVRVEIRGVEVSELVSEVDDSSLYSEIPLDEFIQWADVSNKLSDILKCLNPDEIIAWLRDKGFLSDGD